MPGRIKAGCTRCAGEAPSSRSPCAGVRAGGWPENRTGRWVQRRHSA
jgi:hypothetical protein